MSERGNLESAMAALEAQREALGDEVVEAALRPLRARLAEIAEEPAEQRKLVTVLFADVTGFTSLSQRMDPEEVAATMNKLWRRVDSTLIEHGATIDKHVGDAVMALFGAPVAREDDAERAVLAALAMQEVVPEVARELGGAEGDRALQMRIGLHTGAVHLGRVGAGQEYTAIGDTVNVASRLEGAAPLGGVLISSDTHGHVRGRFDLHDRGLIDIRGRTDPMRVYEVRGRGAPGLATRPTVGGIEIPIAGREREMRRLDELAASVTAGAGPALVTVIGEAGLGASRLVSAFAESLRGRDERAEIIETFGGTAASGRAPYRALRDILAARFGLAAKGSEDDDLDRLVTALSALPGASVLGSAVEESARLLAHLAGLRPSPSPSPHGFMDDPKELRGRASLAASRLVRALAFDRSILVVMIEDLHSIDEGSLELLGEILDGGLGLRLLVVCTSRPELAERHPGWLEREGHHRLDLGPLDEAASGRLVDAILSRAGEVPPLLRSRLIETAEGHPLYIEELVRRLAEQGVIEIGGSEWTIHADRVGELEIPSTLTALVQARLDALSAGERRVLERAAVVGRVFWDEAVRELDVGLEEGLEPSALDVDAALSELERRGLVAARDGSSFSGARELSFSQSIVQEVAYEMILLRLRPLLHRRAAAWLTRRAGESVTIWARRIAEQWEAAGDHAEAGDWWLRAAEQALWTQVLGEAEALFQRALDHLDRGGSPVARRLEAMEGLLEVHVRSVRLAEAEGVCKEICAEAARIGARDVESRAWSMLSRVCYAGGDIRAALETSGRAIDLARPMGGVTLASALRELAVCLQLAGRYREAIGALEEALRIAAEEDMEHERARALRLLTSVYAPLGMFAEAESCCREACSLFRARDHKTLLTASLISLGELTRLRGEATEALAHYEEALGIARELGLTGHELVALANKGASLVTLERASEAREVLEEVLRRAPSKWYGLPETWRFLAEARLAEDRLEDALSAALTALGHATATESAEMIGAAFRVIGEIAGRAGASVDVGGEVMDAPACFERSLGILDEAGVGPEAARTVRSWSRYCLSHGYDRQGRELAKEAHARFDALGMRNRSRS